MKESSSIRLINLKYDCLGYADASVLLEMGNTKILASVTLQDNVPHFLRGKKTGWLTAEYAMLPCATQSRTNRESSLHYKSSRSVEISRLIGRCLRSVTDLGLLGERAIIIDCDVLQADGGTRVASITSASLALDLACKRWFQAGLIEQNILKDQIVGISVGMVDGRPVLDLSYELDSKAEADFNFVLTRSGKLIEVQGTAEKHPLDWDNFEIFKSMAQEGVNQIVIQCDKFSQNLDLTLKNKRSFSRAQKKNATSRRKQESFYNKTEKTPLFSLSNRLEKAK